MASKDRSRNPEFSTCREFSFGKLPTPLNSDSQKTALKLVAVARKIQRLALLNSGEDLTNVTGVWLILHVIGNSIISLTFSKPEEIYIFKRYKLDYSCCAQYCLYSVGLTQAKLDKIVAKSEQIEQKLLELNLRLVHSIALQHQGMGLELDDLVYEGNQNP